MSLKPRPKLQLPYCQYKDEKEMEDGGVSVKAKLHTGDDCSRWIKEFGVLNTAKWIVKSTKTETRLLVCKKRYFCHSAYPRKKAVHNKKSKKINCPARISITIYKKNVDEYPALITIHNNHNHSTDNNEALSSLPASSATRAEFDSYFNIGMKIPEALKFHELKLQNENANLANASVMPKYRTVRYWRDLWRKNPYPEPECVVEIQNQSSTSTDGGARTLTLPHPQPHTQECSSTSLTLDSDSDDEQSEQDVHYTSSKESQNGRMRLSDGTGSAGSLLPETPAQSLQQELLMDLHEMSDKIQNLYPTALGKQFTLTFKGEDGDKSEYVFTSASELRRSGERHSGLRCNECGSDIIGFRYKCVSCADYDLCSACEALGTHADHLMMRIAKPLKLKQARILLQRWCDPMKTAGVTTTEEITGAPETVETDAGPAVTSGLVTSAIGGPVSRSLVLEVGPINTKPKVVKVKTPRGKVKTSKKESPQPPKRSVDVTTREVDSPERESEAKKRKIDTSEGESATEMEVTIKEEPLESSNWADYYSSFNETEPTVQVEHMKVEDPDPLGSDVIVKTEEIEEDAPSAPPGPSKSTATCIQMYTHKPAP